MHVPEADLKAFIIDSGLVPKGEVEAALAAAAESGQSLGDTLVSRGAIAEDALRRIRAYTLGIPFVNLKEHRIPLAVLALIPEPIARTHSIVAYKKSDDTLEVALLDIEDLPATDAVRKKTGLKILARLTDTESIKHSLLKYQKALKDDFGDIISGEAGKLKAAAGAEPAGTDLKKLAEELPTVRITDTLLRHAVTQEASDIHIEPMKDAVLVRYRIGGALHDAMTLPKEAAAGIVARVKVLANLDLGETHLPQDGRFSMETEADKVSLRVSTLPTSYGEKVVLRLLRETGLARQAGEGFTLDMLGFHGEALERVHDALRQAGGLILVAGPAGSGKTTALYTMLDILNTPSANIATIEDPIEYRMKRVNQTQVNPAIGLSAAAGLRALMRQDPDIVMVSEIHDRETAALAVNAALAGHLVLSTINTRSAADAISRLLELEVEPLLLASTVRAIIGQRLARRLCKEKETYRMDAQARAKVASEDAFSVALRALASERLVPAGTAPDHLAFARAKPSVECFDGYRGHVGIQEVLTISPTVRETIMRGGTSAAIEARARKEGMLTLLEDGLYKAARGITSVEEVLRAIAE